MDCVVWPEKALVAMKAEMSAMRTAFFTICFVWILPVVRAYVFNGLSRHILRITKLCNECHGKTHHHSGFGVVSSFACHAEALRRRDIRISSFRPLANLTKDT